MGALQDQIADATKAAMKARDKQRLTLLRMLVAGIQEEQHRQAKDELSDAEELAVLRAGSLRAASCPVPR